MKMNRKMIIRVIAGLLVLILAAGVLITPAMAAESGVTVKLHYNRPDGNYADWSVWFWVEGLESVDAPFLEENGQMVATYNVPSGASDVGFIVKLPNWAAKDVDKDQFIDVAAYLSGSVHVYVESGVEGYTLEPGNDVVKGVKVKEVAYQDGKGIRVVMTEALEDAEAAFAVMGPQGEMTISSVTDNGDNSYTLVPEEAVDLFASYTLLYREVEYAVRMPVV
jgi:pullulanase